MKLSIARAYIPKKVKVFNHKGLLVIGSESGLSIWKIKWKWSNIRATSKMKAIDYGPAKCRKWKWSKRWHDTKWKWWITGACLLMVERSGLAFQEVRLVLNHLQRKHSPFLSLLLLLLLLLLRPPCKKTLFKQWFQKNRSNIKSASIWQVLYSNVFTWTIWVGGMVNFFS